MDCVLQNMPESGISSGANDARLDVNSDVLSLAHLAQYTSGDLALEQELLELFKDQAILQFENIEQAQDEADWVMAVHTIKGSARGIGAGQVADVSADLENVGYFGAQSEKQRLTNSLKHAVAVCVVTIETLIPTNGPID